MLTGLKVKLIKLKIFGTLTPMIGGKIFFNKLTNKRNWIAEYNNIKACVPSTWKQILRNEYVDADREQCFYNVRKINLCHSNITAMAVWVQKGHTKSTIQHMSASCILQYLLVFFHGVQFLMWN